VNIVSRFEITQGGDSHWAYPVVSNGVLYIRHGEVLHAFDVKGE
jgi:outer membrane protein assembly factor BamB